ncbi:radical SAM protein [Desulfovirgula thermocuniculi]|uniref:radical SAM protein n=1 Tax=Desulfovirgula thermocuniculi TaxID=348842 RepID=UPI00041016C9|nr:radical SAM protein [Desulfovirgula thermocuniculi]
MQLAKAAGCAVSTTTNGMLFNDEVCSRVINSGMDLISFSLAGTGPANDYYRRGTSLSAALRAMERLAGYRSKAGSPRPAIHVSYLLLRSAADELTRLPDLLASAGVDAVVVSTLDFVPVPELAGESFVGAGPSMLAEVRSLVEKVAGDCKARGTRLHYRLPGGKTGGRPCAENPLRAVYVAADGSVSPCVFTKAPPECPRFLIGG